MPPSRNATAQTLALTLAATLAATFQGAVPARAADDPAPVVGTVTGGDVTPRGSAPANGPEVRAKAAAAAAFHRALVRADAHGARIALDADPSDRTLTSATATGGTQRTTEASATTLTAATTTELAADKYLPMEHRPQGKSYWCGPATGQMMIRTANGVGFHSRFNGDGLYQANLATWAHMQTDSYGSTSWHREQFTRGLTRWRGNDYYKQFSNPSSDHLKHALTYSIGGRDLPIALDTVEFAGGRHYNGHPVGRTIGHWIAGYGYSDLGRYGHYADPSTSVFPDARPKFSYGSSSMATHFLNQNGLVY
ncbi:hypothetical protein [Janibacter sp. G56]|uniref:hypothetical protein n=1 Tax=Janibacter sp. G56 TaxID=3418717 RepID=UPI003D082FCA